MKPTTNKKNRNPAVTERPSVGVEVVLLADVEVGGDGDARKMHTRPSLDAVGGESKSFPETPRTVVVRCLGGAM